MSNVVRLVLAKTPRMFVGNGSEYPEKPADEILKAEMLALREIRYALVDPDPQKFADLEARAAPLTTGHGVGMRADIEHELRPATVRQIGVMILMLIDSRRDSKELSTTFADMAVSRVSSLQPSYGALQAAVKRLIDEPRAEFKAKMEIADILEAIKDEQHLREWSLTVIDQVPKLIAEQRAKFDVK